MLAVMVCVSLLVLGRKHMGGGDFHMSMLRGIVW